MSIDKEKIVTQDEESEPAAIDQVESRVEEEMKKIRGEARERVAHGLQDKELEKEAIQEQKEADAELNKL